jgi:transglutaminase-like putative cysteine protease
VSFAKEKRLLLGFLALLVPLPLPWNEPRPEGVVGVPFLLAYILAVGLFLYRAWDGNERWLRPWMLNLLGLLYLPFLVFDFSNLRSGLLVRPMMHLGMFALVVKLFSLSRERDKWQALVGIFFLFLASMATSANPAIVIYLVFFLALVLSTLTRFAYYHVAAVEHETNGRPVRLSFSRFLAATTLLSLIVAVPFFLFVPRLRTPYIFGRGAGAGTILTSTGFSDEVSLDVIGRIRSNREVALRFQPDGGRPLAGEIRLKGATYDFYEGRGWRRTAGEVPIRSTNDGRFIVVPQGADQTLQVWLQPLRARSLILPVETVWVGDLAPPPLYLQRSPGGGMSLPVPPTETLFYRVGMSFRPALSSPAPDFDGEEPTLDMHGVSAPLEQLAAAVAAEGTDAERARRLEAHLQSQYEYTLDFVGRRSESIIDDFLFKYKSGHCEYFASAMVLMLRSQGIPARFITGFLDAELNPIEGYYIVRQSNAHAWVEAWADDRWQVFDPTPPAGRPGGEPFSFALMLTQAYDYVLFRWDRYIISYGAEDQAGLLARLRQAWSDFWRRYRTPPAVETAPEQVAAADGEVVSAVASRGQELRWWLLGTALFLVVCGVGLLLWRAKRGGDATRAYTRLRRRAVRVGIRVSDATAPLELCGEVERRFPHVAAPAARIVQFYLRESFGETSLRPEEREEVRSALAAATRGLRKAG